MKRIFLIFAMMLTLTAISQTQTFTGTKTFTSPPKFSNLIQNNTNTKILTLDSGDNLQWKSSTSFTSTIPTLTQVLNANNTALNTININAIVTTNSGSGVSRMENTGFRHSINNYFSEMNCFSGISFSTINILGAGVNLRSDFCTTSSTFQFPNGGGDLMVKVGTNNDDIIYVLKNRELVPFTIFDTIQSEFIDNADAISNGMLVGELYRTGDIVKIVH